MKTSLPNTKKDTNTSPIDFTSIQEVPDSHAWEPHSNGSLQTKSAIIDDVDDASASSTLIPVIDLNDPNVVEVIGHACETWGVFQLINHGIPKEIFGDVEFESRKLFHLPLEEKRKALRSPDGYTGYGVMTISPHYPKRMWHEGFTMKDSSVAEDAKKIWPNDFKQFCDVMEAYERKMKTLAEKLTSLILKSLNLPEETILNLTDQTKYEASGNSKNVTALQLNYYPPCPDPDRAIGAAQHTDSTFLAILHQAVSDNNNCRAKRALQVFKDGIGWIPVNWEANALAVNAGDLLHILSNGRFHNVLHRAVIDHGRDSERITAVYFYGPPPDLKVTPFTKSDDEKPLFRSLTAKEWASIRWKNPRTALSDIRIFNSQTPPQA